MSYSSLVTAVKIILSICFCLSALSTLYTHRQSVIIYRSSSSSLSSDTTIYDQQQIQGQHKHRKLLAFSSSQQQQGNIPINSSSSSSAYSYMQTLFEDLKSRQTLFETTPPEEIKYWFEYTGPLQKYYYRYSKSRKKADSFEGRDDSGVVSSRFFHTQDDLGGGFISSFSTSPSTTSSTTSDSTTRFKLLDYCLKMGSTQRSNRTRGSLWYHFYAHHERQNPDDKEKQDNEEDELHDRCRILIVMNTIGAGKGSTLLWETQPPTIPHGVGPGPWMSEQETASTHLQRNLQEINTLCATHIMAVRIQILVCEPIPSIWVDWMDSLLPDCGGQPAPYTHTYISRQTQYSMNSSTSSSTSTTTRSTTIDSFLEDRPSPIQVVVVATSSTASTCHDLKSGFMEQQMQDLILAPPYYNNTTPNNNRNPPLSEQDTGKKRQQRLKGFHTNQQQETMDPTFFKGTHEDLVSTEPYDLYIGLKWSSLLTLRAVSAFLQASADVVAAAASPNMSMNHSNSTTTTTTTTTNSSSNVFTTSSTPPSSFLIPSFVRVSYVSEENNKVAKWRMHGDFFHPAAWEICKDSFDMIWLPHSLAGGSSPSTSTPSSTSPLIASFFHKQQESESQRRRMLVDMSSMIPGLCYDTTSKSNMEKRLLLQVDSSQPYDGTSLLDSECGQWWILMTEEQMPTPPEVYGNEKSHPLVQGGSNFFWMLTERQRREIVKQKICERDLNLQGNTDAEELDRQCGSLPQAIIPLGDLESFLINFTPNTALGKKHLLERSPGYSHAEERIHDRDIVRERKLLHGQEDIEKALFDYTVYPAALFRKDATLKATRARDKVLTEKNTDTSSSSTTTTSATFDGDLMKVGPQTIKSSYYDVTITKPRQPVPGWCQAIARKGLCALYSEYFRESQDIRCSEACGLKRDWSKL